MNFFITSLYFKETTKKHLMLFFYFNQYLTLDFFLYNNLPVSQSHLLKVLKLSSDKHTQHLDG